MDDPGKGIPICRKKASEWDDIKLNLAMNLGRGDGQAHKEGPGAELQVESGARPALVASRGVAAAGLPDVGASCQALHGDLHLCPLEAEVLGVIGYWAAAPRSETLIEQLLETGPFCEDVLRVGLTATCTNTICHKVRVEGGILCVVLTPPLTSRQ